MGSASLQRPAVLGQNGVMRRGACRCSLEAVKETLLFNLDLRVTRWTPVIHLNIV